MKRATIEIVVQEVKAAPKTEKAARTKEPKHTATQPHTEKKTEA